MKGFEKVSILTHQDIRGWVSNLLDFLPITPDIMKNVHIVSMQPGQIRGNHYHRKQNEALCLLGEKFTVAAKNNESGREHRETLELTTPIMYVVSPGIAHAFRYEGTGIGYLVCFTDTVYDFENPDTNPAILLREE